MLKNYFRIAVRNFNKHRTYAITNILGLTVGLAASILIFLWIVDELSFDKFHAKTDHLYKVMVNEIYPDGRIETYSAPTVKIGDVLRTDFPEIEKVAQSSWEEEMLIKYGDKKFNETGLYADSTLFNIFSFPVLLGDKMTPISNINSISISKRLADKLFAGEDPIGKKLEINHISDFYITSVFRDIPSNSSLQFDFIIPFERWKNENKWANHWRSGATQAFVMLKPKADFDLVDAKVRALIKKNCSECNREVFLYPYSEAYLHGKFVNGKNAGGRIRTVVLFGTIALIILLMACFNFTNLATAHAATRFKEIGVRKSIGANRLSIGLQFIGESILISFLSLFFAVFLVTMCLPILNEITGKSLHINFTHPVWLIGISSLTLGCGILAGLYPAVYLSSLKALAILKNDTISSRGGGVMKKWLIVAQFTVSIVLIIWSTIIYKQLGYILQKDLGFNRERIIVVPQKEELKKNYASYKTDLLQIPSVKNVAFVGSNIFQIPITTTDPAWPGKPANSSLLFKVLRCDEGFIPTMNIKLIAGRNFTHTRSDSSNYLINEKAMYAMGLNRENAIGTRMEMWNGKGEIIGITDDFINGNLHQATEPLVMMYTTTNGIGYYIKAVEGANVNQTLMSIEEVSKQYLSGDPFEYSFLDNVYDNEYVNESVQGRLSLGFTGVAVFICCLGLLGLATFSAGRRTREIGIRKTLGASVPAIVILLSKDFIRLVVIAVLLATPIAYYIINRWLQDFAHRINFGGEVFLVAAIAAILIAAIAIGFQTIKAAVANPVKSLRTD